MQVQKDSVRNQIIESAREEFLLNGFKRSSMRRIATNSKVGLANIYNYFKNKDELFCEVLQPVVKSFDKMMAEHNSEHFITLDFYNRDAFQQHIITDIVDLVKQYKSELKLLLFDSYGSSLESFKEEFSESQTKIELEYLSKLKEKYPHINNNISYFFIHTISSLWVGILEEITSHDELDDEQIRKFVTEYVCFSTIGWRALLENNKNNV